MARTSLFLGPSETAQRLGVSAKALRIYEQHGLVTPLRSARGWRAYGPEHLEALHKALALKRMGFSLAQIARLVQRGGPALAVVLAAQEDTLARSAERIQKSLLLVRAARSKLASGGSLSLDDLIALTRETATVPKARHEEMKQIFDAIVPKHFSEGDLRALDRRPHDERETSRLWEALIAEARTEMAGGDPGSPAAMDIARRWMALVDRFAGGDPALAAKAKSVWTEAMADPVAAPKLPLDPEIFAFVNAAWKKARAARSG